MPDKPPAPIPEASPLGHDWKLANERMFAGRMHWLWQDLYVLRRREYVKVMQPPATKPAESTTAPSAPSR